MGAELPSWRPKRWAHCHTGLRQPGHWAGWYENSISITAYQWAALFWSENNQKLGEQDHELVCFWNHSWMYVSLLTSTGSWSKGRELSLNFLSFCPVSLVLAKLLLMCNPPLCMKECLCKVTPCEDGFRWNDWLFTNRGSSTPWQRLSKQMDAALEATSAWSLWSYFFVLTGPWDTNRNPLTAASHVSDFSQVHRGPVALGASPPDFELRPAELFRCSCSGFQSGCSARADHTWCLQGTRPRNPSAGDNHRRGSGLVGTSWVGSGCFMTALSEFRIVQLRTLTLHTHPDLCSMPRSTPSSWLCHVLYLWQSPAFPGNLENGKLNVRHTI